MDDFDPLVGLPLLEIHPYCVWVWHPKCVPFGDKPVHKIARVVTAEDVWNDGWVR